MKVRSTPVGVGAGAGFTGLGAAADHFLLKIARDHPLQSLTPKELQLDVTPVMVYPKPVRAKAWVRFADIPPPRRLLDPPDHRGRRRDLVHDPRSDVPLLDASMDVKSTLPMSVTAMRGYRESCSTSARCEEWRWSGPAVAAREVDEFVTERQHAASLL